MHDGKPYLNITTKAVDVAQWKKEKIILDSTS